MQMIMLVYNETLESELQGFMAAQGVQKYTELVEAHGHGAAGGTHQGTPVFPSRNRVRYMAVADDAAAAFLDALRAFREQWRAEGVQAFVWPCHSLTEP
ncbi:MAG TPA: hypothetical protein PKM88_04140 [bacterium]|nr:hypothetical protein [bacterium]